MEMEGSVVAEGEMRGGGIGVAWRRRAAVVVTRAVERDLERWGGVDGDLIDMLKGKGARDVKAGRRRGGGGMALGQLGMGYAAQ